jgi:hypothetical protein
MRKKPAGQDKQGRLNDRLKAIAEGSKFNAAPSDAELTPQRSQRVATFKQATLILAHGEKLPVVVKNLSKTGARVEFFKNCELTGEARLMEQSMGLDRRIRIVWQKGGQAGLKFV